MRKAARPAAARRVNAMIAVTCGEIGCIEEYVLRATGRAGLCSALIERVELTRRFRCRFQRPNLEQMRHCYLCWADSADAICAIFAFSNRADSVCTIAATYNSETPTRKSSNLTTLSAPFNYSPSPHPH